MFDALKSMTMALHGDADHRRLVRRHLLQVKNEEHYQFLLKFYEVPTVHRPYRFLEQFRGYRQMRPSALY
jgi:hypothetical protein